MCNLNVCGNAVVDSGYVIGSVDKRSRNPKYMRNPLKK